VDEYEIKQHLISCHTGFVDSYALEGYVPAAEIKRLLAQRPKAIRLARSRSGAVPVAARSSSGGGQSKPPAAPATGIGMTVRKPSRASLMQVARTNVSNKGSLNMKNTTFPSLCRIAFPLLATGAASTPGLAHGGGKVKAATINFHKVNAVGK
jgi:hypothetical protein